MYSSLKQYFKQFENFTETQWQLAEKRIKPLQLKKGKYLLKKGQVCRMVSFIDKGIVRVFYTEKKKEITTNFAAEGEFISDYGSFLTQEPAVFSIEACEDCEFFTLSFEDLQFLYKQDILYSEIGRKIVESLFLQSVNVKTNILSKSAEERYVDLIQTNSNLLQRIPQFLLASYLGVTPEHLSRLRKNALSKSKNYKFK